MRARATGGGRPASAFFECLFRPSVRCGVCVRASRAMKNASSACPCIIFHYSGGERGPLPHAEGEERRRERDEREREEERVMVSWPSASLLTRSVPVNFSGPAGRSTPNDPRISPMLPFILARPGGGSVGAQPRCVVAVFFHMRAASASASAAPSLRPPPAHALASHRTLPP